MLAAPNKNQQFCELLSPQEIGTYRKRSFVFEQGMRIEQVKQLLCSDSLVTLQGKTVTARLSQY
jgi:hypothetical protein